jgi:hypothetical protein
MLKILIFFPRYPLEPKIKFGITYTLYNLGVTNASEYSVSQNKNFLPEGGFETQTIKFLIFLKLC